MVHPHELNDAIGSNIKIAPAAPKSSEPLRHILMQVTPWPENLSKLFAHRPLARMALLAMT
jgi:hypothetical protein